MDTQTLQRFESVVCLFEWLGTLPTATRKQAWNALAECSESSQKVVVTLVGVVKDPATPAGERQQALTSIADTLFPNAGQYPGLVPKHSTETHQGLFAIRLRELLDAKRVSQQELANRIGCSQPAISQLLNRNSRPQKQTIFKLAAALSVKPTDLWPDLDVCEALDAVSDFQADGYVMTDAEAKSLGDGTPRNRPQLEVKPLPTRRQK